MPNFKYPLKARKFLNSDFYMLEPKLGWSKFYSLRERGFGEILKLNENARTLLAIKTNNRGREKKRKNGTSSNSDAFQRI